MSNEVMIAILSRHFICSITDDTLRSMFKPEMVKSIIDYERKKHQPKTPRFFEEADSILREPLHAHMGKSWTVQ